jgi:DNA-binding NarL/FixJ family response regulator
VVGIAATADEALGLGKSSRPDLAIMDIRLAGSATASMLPWICLGRKVSDAYSPLRIRMRRLAAERNRLGLSGGYRSPIVPMLS